MFKNTTMKKLIVLISFMTLLGTNAEIRALSVKNVPTVQDTINLLTCPALQDLTAIWVSEYQKLNPEVNIDIASVSVDKFCNTIEGSGNIGFVTNDYLKSLRDPSIWKMTIGRDVIVPVISSENPFIDEINITGIPVEHFARALTSSGKQTWGMLLGKDQSAPLNYFSSNDELVEAKLAEFLDAEQAISNARIIKDVDELLSFIRNDKYSLGFCSLVSIIDFDNQKLVNGISLLPIDKNGNNRVDYIENFYSSFDDFSRAVWLGKYPRVLSSNIHTVAGEQPENSEELAFLNWVLSDGQQYLYANGYSELIFSERQSKIQRLYANKAVTLSYQNKPIKSASYLFVFLLVLLLAVISLVVSRLLKARKMNLSLDIAKDEAFVLNENSLLIPGGLYFDKSHTWVFMEKDGYVRIGIDDFLQRITGAITRVKMRNSGEKIKKGDLLVSIIQEGKQLDIYSPVSGIIMKNNEKLIHSSSIINSSPYTEGWVYVIEPISWLKEIRNYLMGEKYREWLKSEIIRLKDFLVTSLRSDEINNTRLVMQDGGQLNENMMESLGPRMWEEFQTGFMDMYK